MKNLEIKNPFNAPVYYEETVASTMEISKFLAEKNEPHGTVIAAGFQEKGRGRVQGRTWQMERDLNLPFTILLRYPRIEEIPKVLTLRTGLSVALAVADFAPELESRVEVKWPNDIMLDSKKTAGILCEADGGIVHAGIGINFAQKEFPSSLKEKASSIALALNRDIAQNERFCLLEMILARFYNEFEIMKNDNHWKNALEKKLFKIGEKIDFFEGQADSGRKVSGVLSGIGDDGEILIKSEGKNETLSFYCGEMSY